jgi:hypothetical protein
VVVVFDKFTEWFSVTFVFEEVEDGGESLVISGKGVSWGRSERGRGKIGGGHVVGSLRRVGGSRVERKGVSIHGNCFLSL